MDDGDPFPCAYGGASHREAGAGGGVEQDLLLGEHGGEEREHGAHPQLLEQQRHARPRGRHARVGHVTNLDKVAGVGAGFKRHYC